MPQPDGSTFFEHRRSVLRALAAVPLLPAGRRVWADGPLHIGLTPVFLDDQIGFLERWRAYLEARLGEPVRFVQRGSYSEVLRLVLAGHVEFAWLCGFPYWRHRDVLRLVAVPVYQGAPLYRSYLIRNAHHAAIARFADLRGKTFAYSDPDSNSGYLYVQHRLREEGVLGEPYFGRSFFTWAHRRVVEAVAVQLAQAGAVDGYVWDVLSRLHPELTGATAILERSPPFGFPPIVATATIGHDVLARMRRVLLTMHDDHDGTQLLDTLALDGFEAGAPALFDGIGRMADEA